MKVFSVFAQKNFPTRRQEGGLSDFPKHLFDILSENVDEAFGMLYKAFLSLSKHADLNTRFDKNGREIFIGHDANEPCIVWVMRETFLLSAIPFKTVIRLPEESFNRVVTGKDLSDPKHVLMHCPCVEIENQKLIEKDLLSGKRRVFIIK